MIAQIIALILAFAKAVPAMERLVAGLTEAYTAWKLEENQKDEANKNTRDDALIDAAIKQLPKCPACGSPLVSRGQHGTVGQTPSVPSGSSGST